VTSANIEEPLVGDGVTAGIVRIGDTVRLAFADVDVPRRVALFADAYGMTEQQRRLFVPTAIFVARRYHQTARAAAAADSVFRRLWEQGARDELPRAEAWLEQAGPAIANLIDTPGSRA
jgi:hypothetical protein